MSGITKRVIIVPITYEYDRIGGIFDEVSPDKVYILNSNYPLMKDEGLHEEVVEGVRGLVNSKTSCYENDNVTEIDVDFYQFEEAITTAYRIIYEESVQGNEVFVNISGGTRPVAIALTYACSFHKTGKPLYFPAKDYEKVDGEFVSSGVADTPSEIKPIQTLNMSDIMPESIEEKQILLGLLEVGQNIGMTDLLITLGEIEDEPPEDDGSRSKRNSNIQKHHRYGRKLVDQDLLQKIGSDYELTDTGELIAKLVRVERNIEQQTTIKDF